MMSIPKALAAGQTQTYHQLDYTAPSQSYYKQGDAVKGEWQGSLPPPSDYPERSRPRSFPG